jgi:hypothetical protein
MERKRKQLILLGVLLVVLAVTVYYSWLPVGTTGRTAFTSNERGARQAKAERVPVTAPDVNLEALAAERPKPGPSSRNLFRFRPPPPPKAPPPAPPAVFVPPAAIGPPPPPPVPPIPLKLVMTFTQGSGQRVATLTDAFGRQSSGKEGDAIEGRYRILRITESSVELAYLDGRGRQTIRAGQ